ncbi:MAG: hypothetical protein ACYS30_25315 [Planctomycetota bacterium]
MVIADQWFPGTLKANIATGTHAGANAAIDMNIGASEGDEILIVSGYIPIGTHAGGGDELSIRVAAAGPATQHFGVIALDTAVDANELLTFPSLPTVFADDNQTGGGLGPGIHLAGNIGLRFMYADAAAGEDLDVALLYRSRHNQPIRELASAASTTVTISIPYE